MADIQRIRTQFLADFDDGPIQFKAGDIFALAEDYARSLPPERVKLLGTPAGDEPAWGGGASATVTADSLADTLEDAATTDPASLARISASVSGDPKIPFEGTACVIGDSIEHCQSASGVPLMSWFEYMCAATGGSLRPVGNFGITGNNTNQMLARFDADVGSVPAKFVFIKECANDIGQGITITQNRANKRAMIEKTFLMGRTPILVAGAPFNGQNVQAYNLSDLMLAREYAIPYLNPWLGLTLDGSWRAGKSLDGLHPTSQACREAGEAAAAQLGKFFGVTELAWQNAAVNGMLSNALFLTHSGGVPDQWAIPAGITSAIEVGVSPVAGNWWRLDTDGIEPGWKIHYRLGVSLPSGWLAGDDVIFSGRLKTVGIDAGGSAGDFTYSSMPKVGLYVQLSWTGVADKFLLLGRQVGSDVDGVFSAEGKIPAGATGANFFLAITQSAPVAATYRVAQAQVHNLSLAARL